MRMSLRFGFMLAVLCQFLVLVSLFAKGIAPIWLGEEVRLRIVPVDPRSLLRGHYVQLRYELSEIDASLMPDSRGVEIGDLMYVQLRKNAGGWHEPSAASRVRPEDGVFLRGRVQHLWTRESGLAMTPVFRVEYGIEAFFVPMERAVELERNLRRGGMALLRVAHSGEARLIDVIDDPSASTSGP